MASLGPDASVEEEEARFKEQGIAVEYGPVHDRNVGAFKRLLQLTLPVSYSDSFFQRLLRTPERLRQIVYVHGMFVGAVAGRLEAREDGKYRLHVTQLAVLAAYRGCGLGSALLRHLIRGAKEGEEEVVEAMLCVHTENEEALEFYKKQGFSQNPTPIANYYTNIAPTSAFLLQRWIGEGEENFSLSPADLERKEGGGGGEEGEETGAAEEKKEDDGGEE